MLTILMTTTVNETSVCPIAEYLYYVKYWNRCLGEKIKSNVALREKLHLFKSLFSLYTNNNIQI